MMNKSHGQNHCELAHRMMTGHRATGGSAPSSNMPINPSHYRTGGHPHKHRMRHRHAEGGPEGVNPVTGTKVSSMETKMMGKYKGGRTCHAEGDTVPMPHKRGGSMHRKRHAEGDEIRSMIQRSNPLLNGIFRGYGKTPMYKEGGETMKHGGHKHHSRRRHADGDEVSEDRMSHGGRKKKSMRGKHREHHDFGDTIGNIASGLLGAAPYILPFLLKEGGSASYPKK
jgi:hypothetical protein